MSEKIPDHKEIFFTFLKLGLTSFGGPIAHLGYFREAFVARLKWLDEKAYGELVAICQFLPGPTSSQVGLAIGLLKGGPLGAALAWLAFTIPSAIFLVLFGFGILTYAQEIPAGLLNGLKVVTLVIVAQAAFGMWRSLAPDITRSMLALLMMLFLLGQEMAFEHLIGLIGIAIFGFSFVKVEANNVSQNQIKSQISRQRAVICFVIFLGLLLGLPVVAVFFENQILQLLNSFYRAGALVFGGGHVVLPLLEADILGNNWLDKESFIAGYGATQAVPGPLFTFAAFLGTVNVTALNGVVGAFVCLLVIFLPSFLLVPAVLPFWETLRQNVPIQRLLLAVNAGVVGVIAAALIDPIFLTVSWDIETVGLVIGALIALIHLKAPPWLVVILCAAGGWAIEVIKVI